MLIRLIFVISSVLFLTACQKEMDKFIQGAVKPLPPAQKQASEQTNKFSAGHLRSPGNSKGLEMTVSPTQTRLVGSRLGMQVGISKSPIK